jgi:hypothetical protein
VSKGKEVMNIQTPFAENDQQDRDDQLLVARAGAGDRSALEALISCGSDRGDPAEKSEGATESPP